MSLFAVALATSTGLSGAFVTALCVGQRCHTRDTVQMVQMDCLRCGALNDWRLSIERRSVNLVFYIRLFQSISTGFLRTGVAGLWVGDINSYTSSTNDGVYLDVE